MVDLTWFEQDLENKISRDPTASFGVDPTLINLAGISERNGLEVAGRIRVTDSLDFSGAYTFLDAVDADGMVEIRRPEHSGRVDALYRFAGERGKLNTSVIYNGQVDDLPFVPVFPFGQVRVTLDDYVVVNVAGSYEIRRGVEFFGRVDNVFDEQFQEIFGYQTAGAAAFAGVRITLGGDEGLIQ